MLDLREIWRLVLCGFFLLALLSSESVGLPLRPDRPGSKLAYVVFCGRVVAIDTGQLKVVKRLDFIHRRHLMWMAHNASIRQREHVLLVAGEREMRGRTGWGLLSISLPDLEPIRSTEIVETSKHLSRAPLNGSRARAVRSGFVVQSGANGCRFDYLDSRTSRPITSTTLALPSAGNVYERVWSWTVTPDGRKLLVLTAGGFKEQAYLRVYALPSLARLGDIPLLEILDDSPVALLLDEP